ncbi:MAG: ADP-ribosylation factor-like protein [Candidatus Asgardarchaeia archaeon]
MIHNFFIVDIERRSILFHKKYWNKRVGRRILGQFMNSLKEIISETKRYPDFPIFIYDNQFVHCVFEFQKKPILFTFVADSVDDASIIKDKLICLVNEIKKKCRKLIDCLSDEECTREIEKIVDKYVITKLKVSLVGEGGVGKTTLLRLIKGENPIRKYIPTVAVGIEEVEAMRYGTYSIVVWDFAGQEIFRKLWNLYVRGSDIIFLVCDSTLPGVISAREILKFIKGRSSNVKIWAIANKQDLPNALSPRLIEKILGVRTFGMVAIDPKNRERVIHLIRSAIAEYIGDKRVRPPPPELK